MRQVIPFWFAMALCISGTAVAQTARSGGGGGTRN